MAATENEAAQARLVLANVLVELAPSAASEEVLVKAKAAYEAQLKERAEAETAASAAAGKLADAQLDEQAAEVRVEAAEEAVKVAETAQAEVTEASTAAEKAGILSRAWARVKGIFSRSEEQTAERLCQMRLFKIDAEIERRIDALSSEDQDLVFSPEFFESGAQMSVPTARIALLMGERVVIARLRMLGGEVKEVKAAIKAIASASRQQALGLTRLGRVWRAIEGGVKWVTMTVLKGLKEQWTWETQVTYGIGALLLGGLELAFGGGLVSGLFLGGTYYVLGNVLHPFVNLAGRALVVGCKAAWPKVKDAGSWIGQKAKAAGSWIKGLFSKKQEASVEA
jgi:hypothetical protein